MSFFKNQEQLHFQLAFEGKVLLICIVLFPCMIDLCMWTLGVGEASNHDQNSVAEKQWPGSPVGGDNMVTLQAWELTSLFPPLGNRPGPRAKLVFHVGIAFVMCERVNNSISPKCQFYGAPNAVKTISSLEVVSPEERIINCVLKSYLWLFGLVSLFLLRQCVPSGNKTPAPLGKLPGPSF